MSKQVDPSKLQPQDEVTDIIFGFREVGKGFVKAMQGFTMKLHSTELNEEADRSEMAENMILAFRHVEDAVMRLGKVMQAKNGGESILSK